MRPVDSRCGCVTRGVLRGRRYKSPIWTNEHTHTTNHTTIPIGRSEEGGLLWARLSLIHI
eukprot:1377686-Pyramimonas_sp.AAC.1